MDRRFLLLLLLVLVALCASVASSAPSDAVDDPLILQVVPEADEDEPMLNAEAHFSSFLRRFGKSYADEKEHAYRFSVFKANLRRARWHQKMDPIAVHGITRFSDLTPAEFRLTDQGLPISNPERTGTNQDFGAGG